MGITHGEKLPQLLAAKFLRLVREMDPLPRVICFYTDGVRLACAGSPVLEELRELDERGVELIVCTTCLESFALKDQLEVGIPGSMADILTAMWQAEKVIAV
jgi:intracellular sulfur oxidation DsrE/DsrF family protein